MPINENSFIEAEFLSCPLEHLSLIGITRDESVDFDLAFLTNPMSSGRRLNVVLRIPIRVVDDDNVGASQVDSDPSGLGG